ncbi:GNAT family N-acetyltransferase [Klebsiella quasipneumoniae]|uniref:GNAT family N-acetyltransferase n=1 Tax=Klebsiella quasipneumoniae TaxID=1463165 RepID=UPI000C7E6796|nr:GNAT family protein [Klebsiella quasipneumoniae]HCA9957995.1 GNAT family N-acetyltransferase [Klebsiella quasipneumoniae subsp. quasipneumoniae]MCQ3893503.1 GNAT family N-acetyltransferase [Klebsiella quasipneumoniae]MEC5637540.1 GNAT family protein [Klebsiella quasipneumoniae]PLK57607.1 GNAT family N-acetyltransferase [Klebsiella quasipneumoniae]PLM34547.1 GNAT family N-acetyltransferase [Klebsiella quasipneumoniae]
MLLPLTTPRLLLRRFRKEDLPSFSRYRNLPEVARLQSWSHYGMAEATAFYEQQRSLAFAEDESWFQLAVEIQANGALAGDVGIHFFDQGRQAELGMTFSPAYQHQGYAREAIQAVIALLFEPLAHHRLIAVVDTRNTAAIKLLELLGFRREAHYRQNIFFKGQWGDEYLYALLRSEYQ